MSRRRPSSARWLQEHQDDPYVAAARRDGYRSRAAYKLLELQTFSKTHMKSTGGSARRAENPARDAEHPARDAANPAPVSSGLLIRSGMTVVDLGAAPGGWTQVATGLVGRTGRVVAVDLLPIAPIEGAEILQGDFLDDAILPRIHAIIGASGLAHVILSDMAPNMSGIACVDQSRGELLAESAYAFTETMLHPGGSLVLKVFQGSGFHDIVRHARGLFDRVRVVKPRASRDRSTEHYLLGLGFRRPP